MSKLKLWKPFSLFMVLLLMLSLVAVVPARPVQASVSGITVNPYDTSIIGLNTGYRITMTAGASLNAGDNITVVFPSDTGVPDFSGTPGNVFVKGVACGVISISGPQVTVTIPTVAPIIPGQQFTVTFNKDCGITNPTTSGLKTVTAWTSVEPTHITSSSYEITAVKVFTGATKHSEGATITGAIAAAIAGDTITVPAGTYNENLTVDKSLTLQGASSATVIVTAADPAVSVFNVTASSVNISGFTVTGANVSTTAGIYLGNAVANCNIHDNVLTGNGDGVWLGAGSNHNTLMNNTVNSNTRQGFEIYHSDYNTFINNTANSNTQYGFKMETASNNTFTGNTANSNSANGFYMVKGPITGTPPGCLNNTFTNNTANSNTSYGLREDYGDLNVLTGNTFNGNLVDGIKLKETITNITLNNNNITNNPIGIEIGYSTVQPDVTTWAVNNNNISGNTNYGISNIGNLGILNAKQNYWGNASGPSHDSPVTYGDKVSANVTFSPWLVNTYTGTPPAGEITITTATPLPDGSTGVAYSTPLSATGGSGPYTWALYSGSLPDGLSISGSNLTGTPTVVNTFHFALQVKDGTQATYKNFDMQVYGGNLVVTTTSPLPGGTINVPYGPVQLGATGGTGTYAWSLDVGSGPLPTGLNPLSSDGKISGTPTAAGTFNFRVKVACGILTPGTKDLSITISAAPSVGQKLIGVDSSDAGANNHGTGYNYLSQFTAVASGDIVQIRVKTAVAGDVMVAIYADSSGAPGALLNSTISTAVPTVGWNNIPITSTHVVNGTPYWLAVRADTIGAAMFNATSGTMVYKALAYGGPWPDPAGTGYSSVVSYHSLVAGWSTTVTVSATPAPPVIVTPKTTITFGWAASGGATKYRLQVNTASDFTGTSMFDAEVSTTSQAVTLTVGTPYYWRVKAGNAGGWSGWSATGSITP